MTIAVIGAGIAGACCARAVHDAGVDVVVLERGRSSGGRMASPALHGRAVDTGASYFTARDGRFLEVVEHWGERGLARPWTDTFHLADPTGLRGRKSGPLRFGAEGGLRSLVQDLLVGIDVRHRTEVVRVGPGPTADGVAYDAVVLAMPDPQAERLLDPTLTEERDAVRGRGWEPVLALAAGWDDRCWEPELDGCFVDGSDVLGWIADDGRRRGDSAAVLVAHSTSPFAAGHLSVPDAAAKDLVAATRGVLDIGTEPSWTSVQRWSLARPLSPRDAPFHLGSARVGLCGDSWGQPRVETASVSGLLLGEALVASR